MSQATYHWAGGGTQRDPGCVRQQSKLLHPGILVRNRVLGGTVNPMAGLWGERQTYHQTEFIWEGSLLGKGKKRERKREKKTERQCSASLEKRQKRAGVGRAYISNIRAF